MSTKAGQLVLQNFRYGLDTRRSELTSVPGTLLRIVDGHLNQGGEIEKRKAFARYFDSVMTSASNVFGLQETSRGLTVFGSVALPAGLTLWVGDVAASFGTAIANCPPLSYVRCQHPNGSQAMSSIVHSTVFGNVPFVIAAFSDGNTYPYYGGTIVSDFTAGLILASQSGNVTAIQTALAALVNATDGYTGVSNTSGLAVSGDGGEDFTAAVAVSRANTLPFKKANSPVTPIDATGATAQLTLQVTGAAATDIITDLTVNGTSILNSATIVCGPDVYTTLKNLALAVNTYSSTSGYSAVADHVTLSLFATATGTTPNGFNVVVSVKPTPSSGVTAGASTCFGALSFSVSATPSITTIDSLNVAQAVTLTRSTTTATATTATAHGLMSGQSATITGAAAPFSVTAAITVTSTTTFTYTVSNSGATSGSGTTSVNILHAASFAFATYGNFTALLAAIVVDINLYNTGYTAYSSGINLYLSKRVTSSADANLAMTIGYTGGTLVIATVAPPGFNAFAYPLVVNASKYSGGTVPASVCTVSGGTAPYTYSWEEASTGSGIGWIIVNPNSNTTRFITPKQGYQINSPDGKFVCKVTDSSSPTPQQKTSNVVVTHIS